MKGQDSIIFPLLLLFLNECLSHLLMLDNYQKKKNTKKPQKQYMQIFTYVLSVTKIKKKKKEYKLLLILYNVIIEKGIYIYIYNAIVSCQRLYIMQR